MKDDHPVTISGTEVGVTGETGLIESTRKLMIGGSVAETARVTGDHVLRGNLQDGSAVEARVHQGAFGPTEVEVRHDGEHVVSFTGFVI